MSSWTSGLALADDGYDHRDRDSIGGCQVVRPARADVLAVCRPIRASGRQREDPSSEAAECDVVILRHRIWADAPEALTGN